MLKIASAYMRYRIFIGVYGHYMVTNHNLNYVYISINVATIGVTGKMSKVSTKYYESTALTN